MVNCYGCQLICSHRLAVRTLPFHGGNRGSNPRGSAKIIAASLEDQVGSEPTEVSLILTVAASSGHVVFLEPPSE